MAKRGSKFWESETFWGIVAVAVILLAVVRLHYGRGWFWRKVLHREGFQEGSTPPPKEPVATPAPTPEPPPQPAAAPPMPAPPPPKEMMAPPPAPMPAVPFDYGKLSLKVAGLKDQFDTLQRIFMADMSIANMKALEETQIEINKLVDVANKDEQSLTMFLQNTLNENKKMMRIAIGAVEGFKEYTGNPYTPMTPNSYQSQQFRLGQIPPRI